MARNILVAGNILLLLMLSSCSPIQSYVKVIEGNYAFSRGEYKEANLVYVESLKAAQYSDRLLYNLGNVYHSLGESEAAVEEWQSSVEASRDPELLFRIAFNRGVIQYERGNYQNAYNHFREALRLNPEDLEAKANLEYCLRKLNLSEEEQNARVSTDTPQDSEDVSEDAGRILEYVKRSSPTLLNPEHDTEQSPAGRDW